MKITEEAKKTVDSGIVPIFLSYYPAKTYGEDEEVILRSTLIINSLDVGTLTPSEYRYVARRTNKGDQLVCRHIDKVFSEYSRLFDGSVKGLKCVTVPVFPRTFKDNKLSAYIFNALAKYPEVDAKRICVELSSDILFEEDISEIVNEIETLRGMSVKIAVNEIGDEFCPLTRLFNLHPDYIFADSAPLSALDEEVNHVVNTVKYFHLANIKVYSPIASNEAEHLKAKRAEFDGYMEATPILIEEEGEA